MTTLTSAPSGLPSQGSGVEPYVLPAMAGPPATGGTFTGAEVYRVIRQRLVMILFLWLFFIAATAVGTFVWIRYWPVYKAMALVRVQSITPANPLEPLKPQEAREDEVSRLLQDQSLQVMSPEVLDNVIADPLIRETAWFKEAEKEKAEDNEDPFDLLSDIVKADPVPESNLLSISVSWKVPAETPKLVNTVVDKYMAVIENAQKNKIRKASDTLAVEVTRAKRDYDQKQADLDSFRSNVESTGTGRDELKEKVLTLTAIETELAMDMDGKRTIYEQFEKANPEDLPITPDLQAILNSDPTIVQLDNLARAADADLSTVLSRFGPKHRVVQQQQAARDAAMDRASEERRMKTLQYQINQLDQARTNYLEAQAQLLAIRERLSGAQAELLDKDQKYSSYLRLEEETKTLKETYLRLVEQQQFVMMTLNQEHTVQITPLGQAKVPNRRSSPKWEILMPVGVVFGLAVSIGFALLLEMADKSVRTPRDVQRQSMTVLATIPAVEDDEVEISRVETASLDAPQSITAEAFRTLRANLFFCAPPEQQAAILVTSPSGGNGKTTVAVNLAISIALSGRRVLIVDANFRRPCLPRIFPDMRPDGLSNILIGQSHLDDCVMATSVPGLDVLGAGPLPPNPAELLGSTYLRDMLADARARYDQVIFDGPPVLLVSDAMVLSGAVDGVLLICQYRSTSRGALQRTQQQLDAINARIFGAVLNRVETRAGGYFREAYREFYEYSEMPEDAGGEAKQLDADAADQLQPGEGTPGGEAPREGDNQNLLATDNLGTEAAGDSAQDTSLSADGGTETQDDTLHGEAPIDVDAEIASIGGESILADEDLALDDDTPSIDDETNPEDPHRT